MQKFIKSSCIFNIKPVSFMMAGIFFFEFAGYWTHSLNLLFGFILLSSATIFHLRESGRKTIGLRTFIGIVLGIISLIGITGAWIPFRAMFLALYAVALTLCGGKRKNRNRDLLSLAAASLFFCFLITVYLSPETVFFWPGGGIGFWSLVNKISTGLSFMAGIVTGSRFLAGPSFSGIFITVFIIVYIVIASDFFRCRERKSWIRTLILILCAQFLYLFFFAVFPAFLRILTQGVKSLQASKTILSWIRNHYPLFMPLVLMISDTLILIFSIPAVSRTQKKIYCSNVIYPAMIFILAGTGFFILNTTIPSTPDKKKIVFYKKGFLNWDRPNYMSFGNYSGGMFGNLPIFAESLGMRSKITPELSKATLSDAGILMMMNVNEPLTREEIRNIHEFVESGGSLLLLGDHTQLDVDGRNLMNEILEPSGIRYNFDSADFFIGGWQHSYQFMRHPVTLDLGDLYNQPGIVVGASLSVTYPAVPLVIGRYGYSDPGEKDKGGDNGYLGNLDYDSGEELGDIVLVAAQDMGKGKIMVFGDTSTFANPLLFNTYDFVDSVFTWLRQSDTYVLSKWWTLLGVLLFAASLLILFFGDLCVFNIFIMVLTLLITSYISNKTIRSGQTVIPAGNVAYIDNSHFENFQYDCWEDPANTGLIYNVMRVGYNTLSMNTFSAEKLRKADLFIIANPTKPFTGKEISDIHDFVRNGGRLLVCTGWEERECLTELLDSFDITIGNQPLGGTAKDLVPISEKNGIFATFIEAWPVKSSAPHDVIASWMGHPVIITRTFGNGKICVVGDSQFLTNRMLEHEDHGHLNAILFFRWLLYNLRGETAPPLFIQGRTIKHE